MRTPFSAVEQGILRTLDAAKGHPLTTHKLLDEVWGFREEGTPGNLAVRICYLRKKLNKFRPELRIDTTNRGYALRSNEQVAYV